jgi:hypothetical protein
MKHPTALLATTLVVGAFAAGGLTAQSLVAGDGGVKSDDTKLTGAAAASAGALAPAATGSSVDSCTLVTEAEAKAALGAAVSKVPDPSQCTYVAMDGTSRALSVTVPDYAASRKDFAPGVDQAAHALEGTVQPIPAGDEAYALVAPTVSEGLARVGDTYVVVVLTKAKGSAAEQADQLNGLLQTAFGRL